MNLSYLDVINGRGWTGLLLQMFFMACSVAAAISLEISHTAVVSMILMTGVLIAFQMARGFPGASGANWPMAAYSSVFTWLALILMTMLWNLEYGIAALASVAAMAWATPRMNEPSREIRWKILVVFWLMFLSILWLCTGYGFNFAGVFYAGLLSLLGVLVLCRQWINLSPIGAQVVNTLILLLAGLPLASLVCQIHGGGEIRPEEFPNYASYDKARGDPASGVRAHEYYEHCYELLSDKIYESNPEGHPEFRPRPNSHGYLGQCLIQINNLGFRGGDIPLEKGNSYRIVAVGESTTFGMTLRAGEKPWPELLEQFIRERLKTRRPVEVINAGIPSYTLGENLRRFPHYILPLKPDMIISYHGANCFFQIDMNLLRPQGEHPPKYEERPLKLAADFEQRIRLMRFRSQMMKFNRSVTGSTNPMQTELAADYRNLIRIAATNHIRLMLANYAMAVNGQSGSSLLDFYQAAAGDSLPGRIRANEIQTQMIQQLARESPAVGLIDTHPHLDGAHEKFIDYMHFTQEGRQQMAENIFAGIRKTLEEDLGQ